MRQSTSLSDDVYVLTAEEAEKHVSPPELRLLNVKPEQAHVKPGGEQSFTVEGVDQYGNNIEPGAIAWTATGGTIGADERSQQAPMRATSR